MTKKIIALLIAAVMIFSAVSVFAEEFVTVKLDGEELQFEVPAQIIDDRTMVPMRDIFEKLGAKVDWDEEHQGIMAFAGHKIITMMIGQNKMFVADFTTGVETELYLDVPPMLVNDKTLVPLRAVSESLGVKVDWSEALQTVYLSSK